MRFSIGDHVTFDGSGHYIICRISNGRAYIAPTTPDGHPMIVSTTRLAQAAAHPLTI
jgi:hypothetical protein